jgi:hypothetical protein
MSGTPLTVQTECVDENMRRVYFSFTVPTRYVDYQLLPVGVPNLMVPIAIVGSTSPLSAHLRHRGDRRAGMAE